jgi:hypothetical protein
MEADPVGACLARTFHDSVDGPAMTSVADEARRHQLAIRWNRCGDLLQLQRVDDREPALTVGVHPGPGTPRASPSMKKRVELGSISKEALRVLKRRTLRLRLTAPCSPTPKATVIRVSRLGNRTSATQPSVRASGQTLTVCFRSRSAPKPLPTSTQMPPDQHKRAPTERPRKAAYMSSIFNLASRR